jgi:hypothetical protein
MSKNLVNISKTDLKDFFKIINLPCDDFGDNLKLGDHERTVLSRNDLHELVSKYCFFGVDGTTAKLSDEDSRSPYYVSVSVVGWHQDGKTSKTKKFNQRILVDRSKYFDDSTIRTILEMQSIVCILKARKSGSTDCTNCPFKTFGCNWVHKLQDFPKVFGDKIGVGIVDLPVNIPSMLKGLPILDPDNREFVVKNIKAVFTEIREQNLPIIFVQHKARVNLIGKKIISELDKMLNDISMNLSTVKSKVSILMKSAKSDVTGVNDIRKLFGEKHYTDFLLLNTWFNQIGIPSPSFNVDPVDENGNWDKLKFHYLTWGYTEKIGGINVYLPSCWVRVGYTPALTPEIAHKIVCLEMMLDNGHPISLWLAHTECNSHRDSLITLLREYINKNSPDFQKIGYDVKSINKSRLFQNY